MDSKQLQIEWNRICAQIKTYSSIDEPQMNAFFSRLVPQAMSEGFLIITADNDFIKTWIEHHYVEYIKQALRDLSGIDYTVLVAVDTKQPVPAQTPAPTPVPTTASNQQQNTLNTSAPSYPAEQQADSQLTQTIEPEHVNEQALEAGAIQTTEGIETGSSTLTFSNFVIGESNRLAYSTAVAVAEKPGTEMMNPLFIYGKSGLGKTHLLRAIQNYINETLPHLKTVYVDTDELVNNYMEAAVDHDREKESYRNFKKQYETADVLLIDDVQYLQGKKGTLDIVFQIFNKLIAQGKQVVLSADRAPKNIDIDERYNSRFNMGVTADIQPPSVETKLGIVNKFVEEYCARTEGAGHFTLSDEIKKYIAENSSSNIRELKSAVTKVIYRMNVFNKNDLSLDEVRALLENHFSGGAMKKLTVADIQKSVESYYKVSHADLIGKKRSRNIVYPRQIAIYLSRQMLDLPFASIAKNFGNKDHTTIMYAVNNVEEKMKENRELREELETLRQMIKDQ